MLWRLAEFIILFAIIFLFIVFNLGNKCDISFGFTEIKDVPVFLTAFSSFFIGMLCVIPFVFAFRSRKKAKAQEKGLLAKASKKQDKKSREKIDEVSTADSGLFDKTHYGID